MKLLTEKRREFILEIHLAFHDHMKAFVKVKRENCWKYYKAKLFPIYC
jgi:hypothetical protein